MNAAVLAHEQAAAAAAAPARWAIARHVWRRTRRGALIWGVVFGLWVAATVKAFIAAYPTATERQQAARELQAFAALLGPPHHAETVAGFTAWRVLTAIVVIGAVWGLLTSTSVLRGDEDAGRWEILLSGPTTRGRAAAEALAGLGLSLLTMLAVMLPLVLLSGRMPGARFPAGGSVLFALALVAGAAMFLAVGALASQLAATRGQAATLASAALGISYALRMVADSSSALGWLRWLTPLGWLEELQPMRDARPLALAPVAVLVVGCSAAAVALAGRRDLGASALRERPPRPGGEAWLTGPTALALRLARPSGTAWLVGLAAYGLVSGSLTRAATAIMTSSPAFAASLGRLGVRRLSNGYLGVTFLMFAVAVAVLAAAQVAALRDEEASGRLDNLLVRPLHRARWLGGRLAIASGLVVLVGLASALFTWVGAWATHAGVGFGLLLGAGVNAVLPALVVVGAGALVFGLRPRLTAPAAYGLVAWSFLAELLGSLVKGSHLIRDSSLFTRIALAPAANPDWGQGIVLVTLGAALATAGALAFARRDLSYE